MSGMGGLSIARGGMIRRRYAYRVAEPAVADELVDVPIPVWSTKSFVASWSGAMKPGLVESNLVHPNGAPGSAIGTFVNRMPFEEIHNCVAFYAGQAYPLPGGIILKDEAVQLVLDKGTPASKWLQDEGKLAAVLTRARAYTGKPSAAPAASEAGDGGLTLWGMMFHEMSLRNDEGVLSAQRLAPHPRSIVAPDGREPG